MLFASPLQPILSAFAPSRWRVPQGLVPLKPGTTGYFGWSTAGSPRFLENPSRTSAPL
jgi:hypothetical protein